MSTLTITQARNTFLQLADQVQEEPVLVTRHGKPVMAVLSAEQYEGLLETLEILQDPAFANRLRKSRAEASSGRTLNLAQAAARLGF